MDDIHTVLVLGPHTDDGELGCGGTIARFVAEGKTVHYAPFSCAEDSVPEGLPKDVLVTEVKKAAATLGIPADRLHIFRYPVRRFPQHRQDILENLVALRRKINPDLVLLPTQDDIHQDHQVIANEGIRAFKRSRILGYELPWNTFHFQSNTFVFLKEAHLRKKMAAINCYESQVAAGRDYLGEAFIRGLATTRGVQIGAPLAEAFEMIRWKLT